MSLKTNRLATTTGTGAWALAPLACGGLAGVDQASLANLSTWPIMIHNHWMKEVSTPGGILVSVLREHAATPTEPKLLAASHLLRACGHQTLRSGEIAVFSLPEAGSAMAAKASVTILRFRELGGPATGYAKLTLTREGDARRAVIEPFTPFSQQKAQPGLGSATATTAPESPRVLLFLGSNEAPEAAPAAGPGEGLAPVVRCD